MEGVIEQEVTAHVAGAVFHPTLLVLTVMLLVTGFAVLKLTVEGFIG